MSVPCKPWTGRTNKNGYGIIGGGYTRKLAHRVAWEEANGRPVPEGLVIGHVCHDLDLTCLGGSWCPHHSCIEPTHLKAMSQGDNVRAGRAAAVTRARWAARTECIHGHPAATCTVIYADGHPRCKPCELARMRAAYWRRKAAS